MPLPSSPQPAAWPARLTRALGGLWRQPRSPQFIVLLLALWLASAGNLALWRALGRVPEAPDPHGLLRLQYGVLVFFATALFLSLFAWPRFMKPVWALVLLLAAFAQHFMWQYGIFIDDSMVRNVFQTDPAEARDLLSWGLLAQLLLVAGWPLAWLACVPVRGRGAWRSLGRSALLFVLCLAGLVGSVLVLFHNLAPLMRNHKELRYQINPLASIVSAGTVALEPLLQRPRPFVKVSAGAALGPDHARQARPPLLLLVVGETGRADHFALNGYPRSTTPELAARNVLSWRGVHSCGTNTLTSVPCMFSPLGKHGYENRDADYETLLDVAQAAGLAVLWIDNQTGCKGVCDRVPHVSTSEQLNTPEGRALCQDGECLDEFMLAGLSQRLAQLPEARRRNGVLLVMHQMGSHGPAYARRSTPATKRFLPECTSPALADCPHDTLINAYDNSIAYTDHMLASAIDWLQAQARSYDTGLLYLSDHGESLGEYGLFLHGMPYAIAPEEQKHIPFVLWPGRLLTWSGVNTGCLARTLDAPLTHDNLYPTVLGLLDVRTPTYQRGLDAFAGCRAEGNF